MKNKWQIRRLDDVCELITCGVAAKPQYVDEGVPFLSAKNVKDGQIIWSGYNCISQNTHKELTKNNKPLRGDILYTRVGSYGEAAVIEDDLEFSVFVSLTLIKVDKNLLNNHFLKYYLNSDFVKKLAKKSISSSGVGNLNVGTVREFPIPFPPIEEQKRIVGILDEVFEGVAKAKENVEGNLRNVSEVFEAYLQSVFSSPKKGWESKKLGEVCDFKNGQAHEQEIDEEGKYKLINSKFISSGGEKYKKTNSALSPLFKGDIVFVMSDVPKGKTLAKCFTVDEDDTYTLNQRICVIRSKNFDKKFLFYHLNRHRFLLSFDNGENQTNLRKDDILNCPLFVPTFAEQKSIVTKLDALSTETKKLEAIYKTKLNHLEELKKSILKKAFNGEL